MVDLRLMVLRILLRQQNLKLSKKALPEFEVRIPSKAEAKTMNDTLAPYYERIAEVLQENERLIHLRNALLPKLMSDELKISE